MAWLYHTYAAWQRKSFRLGHAIDTGQLGAQQLAASCRFAPWQFSTGAARYAPELLFDIPSGREFQINMCQAGKPEVRVRHVF